jgi:hypothetical protein
MQFDKQLGKPLRAERESQDLRRNATEKPNLAVAAAWLFGALLVVVVAAGMVLTG